MKRLPLPRYVRDLLVEHDLEVLAARRGKHWVLKCQRGGNVGTLVFALSPSDYRAIPNLRAEIRKQFGE